MSVGNPVICAECGYLHGNHAFSCTRDELRRRRKEVEHLRAVLRDIVIGGIGDRNWSADEIRSYAAAALAVTDAERSGSSRAVRGPPAASGP